MNDFPHTTELDELLIPSNGRYKTYPILALMGGESFAPGKTMAGFGQAPFHYITTRGTEQDGSTPIAMRWDDRTLQLSLEFTQQNRQSYWLARQRILTLINPVKSFGSATVAPLIYRKLFPSGRKMRGSDANVTNLSATVIVPYARFFDVGGLLTGAGIILGGVAYRIASVQNDFTVELTAVYAGATSTTTAWEYITNQTSRELFCLPAQGPSLNISAGSQLKPEGFFDTIRFTAHNPFWFGTEQTQVWALPENFGDLVFDDEGAYFGEQTGAGRWLFEPTAVSGTVSVVYWGSYRARPRLVIDGPAESISFQNQTTGLSIQVEHEIVAGESITIDTLNTTVTKSDGTNLLHVTSGDISLFSIEPENIDHGRINDIFVSFSGADNNSRATMFYQNAYTGI